MTAKCWTDSFKIEESDSKEYKSVVNAFHAVDWASTSLGALSTWDLSTRSEVCAVFKTSSTPRTVFLDEACYFIYNARAGKMLKDHRHGSMFYASANLCS